MAASLPELPAARRAALAAKAGVAPADAALVVDRGLDGLVGAAIERGADPRLALARAANELAADIEAARALDPAAFTALLRMEADRRLTATQAKSVLAELLASGGDPVEIAAAAGYEALGGGVLAEAVDAAVAAHPAEWARLQGGEQKLMGFFVGKVMAATRGRADGRAVTEALRTRL